MRPPESIRPQLVEASLADRALVDDSLGRERSIRVEELLDTYVIKHPLDLAYWLYSDWRMSRFGHAAYRAGTADGPLVWPLMDERVLQVVAAVAPGDRALETVFYAALCRLAPELAAVPLYEDTWRFDNGPLGTREFPAGRDERRQPFREQGRGRTPERRFATIQPLFRQVLRDSELDRLIRPDVLRALCDEPDPALALGRPHMQIINFMWRATAVALVLEGAWLTAR